MFFHRGGLFKSVVSGVRLSHPLFWCFFSSSKSCMLQGGRKKRKSKMGRSMTEGVSASLFSDYSRYFREQELSRAGNSFIIITTREKERERITQHKKGRTFYTFLAASTATASECSSIILSPRRWGYYFSSFHHG